MNELNLIGRNKKGKLFESKFQNSLVLTFNIDLIFYENSILKEFIDLGSSNNLLIADNRQLLLSMQSQHKFIGKDSASYTFFGVNSSHLFHSKAILLTGKDESRLFLGSGNMTYSGLSNNKELFGEFTTKNPQHHHVFVAFQKYVERILLESHQVIHTRLQGVFDISSFPKEQVSEGQSNIQFLHNLDAPILQQVSGSLTAVKKIHVISPFFDKDLETVYYLKQFQEDVSLYFQPSYTNFSVDNYKGDIPIYELPGEKRHLHAKTIIFEYDDTFDILFGSPNCTRPALLDTTTKGNAEIAVFLQNLSKDFLRYYIPSELIPIDPKTISSMPFDSVKDMPKFVINNANYTKKSLLEIILLKPFSEEDVFTISVNGTKLHDITILRDKEHRKISFSYNLPQDQVNYLSITLNGENSNTVVILNEQKNIYKTNRTETRAMNELKNYFTIDSVEGLAFVRSFDPFIQLTISNSRDYSIDKEAIAEDEEAKAEIEVVKESKDFYISYNELPMYNNLIQKNSSKGFIFDLLNTIPNHYKVNSSNDNTYITPAEKSDETEVLKKNLGYQPEYEKFIRKVIERTEILARAYSVSKIELLDEQSFLSFFRDAIEIIPLSDLLLGGLTYKIVGNDTFNISFSSTEFKQSILPLTRIICALWKNAKNHEKFLSEQLPKSFITKMIALSIGNLVIIESFYKSLLQDQYISLNRTAYDFAIFQAVLEILEAVKIFSVSESELKDEYESMAHSLFERILHKYGWNTDMNDQLSMFFNLVPISDKFHHRDTAIRFIKACNLNSSTSIFMHMQVL